MGFYDVINWKLISVFGKNKVINRSFIYLILVPMLAKLFSKIQSPIELSLGGEIMKINFVLPFSWKLFFFSALVFTLGAIIYNLFAPSIIKDNNSLGDFLNDRKSSTHLVKYRDEIGINERQMGEYGVNIFDLLNELIDLSSYRDNKNITEIGIYFYTQRPIFDSQFRNDSNLNTNFWMLYNYANESRKIAIILSMFFYILGFIMILIVFIQSVIEVIKWV